MTFKNFRVKYRPLGVEEEPSFIEFFVSDQMVLLPWGWTSAKPDNYDEIYSLARAGVEALTAVHGTK